jgi:hypothetical protein
VEKNLRGAIAGPDQFVVVGNDGTVLTSTNPASWSGSSGLLALGDGMNLRGVTWGNGRYVAVGNDGMILTSDNGSSWNLRNFARQENLHGVAYGQGTFVAVGNGGTILQCGVLLGLSCAFRREAGGFELTIAGESHRPYRLQATTNLTNWIDLWTYNRAEPVSTILDVTATNCTRRYYRVLSP